MSIPHAPLRRARGAGLRHAAAGHPVALVIAGLLLYSTGPVMVQASTAEGPAFAFWRLWLGVPVVGLAAALSVRSSGRLPAPRAWRWALWAGVCFGLHQLAFVAALKATSVTDVALMNVLSPLLVGALALPLFGERTGRRFRAWSLVAMGGAAVVVLGASAGPQGDPVGMLLAALNVVAFAGFFLLSKLGRAHIDVWPFLAGMTLAAALTVTALVVVTGEAVGPVGSGDVALALAVAVGPGTLGHFLSTWPLDRLPANLPPVIQLAQPLLAGALAAVFLSEPVTATHLAGGALTLGGVLGASRGAPPVPVRPPEEPQEPPAR